MEKALTVLTKQNRSEAFPMAVDTQLKSPFTESCFWFLK